MYGQDQRLSEKIEGAKKIFSVENSKGVEHFKKFEETIEGLAKTLTRAHDRVDTRAIKNRMLTKRVAKLEERCDTLTKQVRGVIRDRLMVANDISLGCFAGVPL